MEIAAEHQTRLASVSVGDRPVALWRAGAEEIRYAGVKGLDVDDAVYEQVIAGVASGWLEQLRHDRVKVLDVDGAVATRLRGWDRGGGAA